jgi:hypothetical protein
MLEPITDVISEMLESTCFDSRPLDRDTKNVKDGFSKFIFIIDIKVGQNNIIMPLHTLIIGHSICKWLEHYLLTKKDRRLSADYNIKEMTTVAWHGISGRTLNQLIKHIAQNRKKLIVLS